MPASVSDRHQRDEHQAEAEELAEEKHPLRHRRRVDVFAQPRIPLPPDQLAGEEDDEQRHHHPEVEWTA